MRKKEYTGFDRYVFFPFNFKAHYQTILVYRYIKQRTFISLHKSLIFSIGKIRLQSLILHVHTGDYKRCGGDYKRSGVILTLSKRD